MVISDEMLKNAHLAYNELMWSGGTQNDRMRAALEAVAPSIRAAAMEDAAKIVEDAGWFRSSPDDVHWSTIDEQIGYSIAAIRAAKETA